jgi:DNA-binding CsgD family transcriptional regulator
VTSSHAAPNFVVIDARHRVTYVARCEGTQAELGRIIASPNQLQPEVAAALREMEHRDDGSPLRAAALSDDYVLRVARLVGEGETMFALSVEEDPKRKSLSRATRRHQLTRRETTVLTLILDGSSAGEIAAQLGISEHTVQGYFKRLLAKTGARNRVAMVAEVLDWEPRRQTDAGVERRRSGVAV